VAQLSKVVGQCTQNASALWLLDNDILENVAEIWILHSDY